MTSASGRIWHRSKANGRRKVFVVDDDPLIRKYIAEILKVMGFQVLVAEDGLQALQIFRGQWRELDAVILDLVMPGCTGKTVFHAMKAINPDVRCLLISGYSANKDIRELLASGVRAFLKKPITMETLAEKLNQVLA